MAFAYRQSARRAESLRASSVCRVHTCVRCRAGVATGNPCSFVPALMSLCLGCESQERTLVHLSISRSPWGAALARTRRD
jgi:hypothetical protein